MRKEVVAHRSVDCALTPVNPCVVSGTNLIDIYLPKK